MPQFKVRDLMIHVLPGAVEPQQGEMPEGQGPQVAMDLCAVTHNPLDCTPGITSPLCGVGCTDCTGCTQCTGCTNCTHCTGCTNCTQCSAPCTRQCTAGCSMQCSGACTFPCTGYCSNTCTNPSFSPPVAGGGGQAPPGCGCTATRPFATTTFDPILLSELKAQLKRQLAQIEAAELRVGEQMQPQTLAEAEMLERKMTDAMESLRARKIELAARQQSKTVAPEPGDAGTPKRKKQP